jgi:NAD(P)-dependent dehydrogenase (short-subunit alcohol dehydrogenase family)
MPRDMPRALIVGASRGLGLGLVEELARRGWEVMATVRDTASSGELNQLALGGKTRIERLDVTDADSARELHDLLGEERFDLVFLNAGMGHPRGRNVTNVDDETIHKLFDTNAIGPVRTAEILLDLVRPQTGVVAFMTSRLGSVADRTSDHADLYSASKAALNSLTRAFAARHEALGLSVLSLHPGWVKTAIGGDGAPLEVEDSVPGLVDIIEKARGSHLRAFLDYQGKTIPW